MSSIISEELWLLIMINFITDLLYSLDPLIGTEYNSIIVVVEQLTK
jgi:hypothetical protein